MKMLCYTSTVSRPESMPDVNDAPQPDSLYYDLNDTSVVMDRHAFFIEELTKAIELCMNLTDILFGPVGLNDVLFSAQISKSIQRLTLYEPLAYDIQRLRYLENLQSIKLLDLSPESATSLPQMAASLPRTLRSLTISVGYSVFGP